MLFRFSGSKIFILQLRKILEDNISGIHMTYREHFRKAGSRSINGRILTKDSTLYVLNLSSNNLRKLRDFMYSTPSDLKLLRKYEKFVAAGDYKPYYGDIDWVSFEDAKKIVISKNFRSMNEYHNWQKDNRNKYLIPFTPQDVYKDEWIDWPDFLGHYRLSYKELSDLAIQNNIGGHREYYSWIKKIRGNTCGKYPSHPGEDRKSVV